jgi:hypothetical protein
MNSQFYNTFNDGFWLTMGGAIIGLFGMFIKYCFNSNCSRIQCCFGLLHIEREIQMQPVVDTTLDNESHSESKDINDEFKI